MPTLLEVDPRDFLRKEPISTTLFQTDKAVTIEHIRLVLGERLLSFDDDDIEKVRSEVCRIKREATSWGHTQIEGMIVDNFVKLGYPELSCWAKVLDNWKLDEAGEYVPIYWKAVYGMFDVMSRWEIALETRYMAEVLKMSYPEGSFADRSTVSSNVVVVTVATLSNSFLLSAL